MPDSTWMQGGTVQAPDKTDKALLWIKNNRDTVIGGLVITAAAAIFGVWVSMHYSGIREMAWKNLFIAQQTAFSGDYAGAAKQLDAIETNYRKTAAWGYSVMTRGDLLFRQDKFAEAAAEYARIAASGPEDLAPFAIYNIARSNEAAADMAGAQAQYRKFLAAYPDHFMAPEVHLSLAAVLDRSGGQAEAKAAYEKIVLLYPDTYWAAAAKSVLMPEQKTAKQPAK